MRFNNQYLHEIVAPNLLENRACYIIGGGPSLINFSPSRLAGKYVLGVNKAFAKFNPQMNWSNDKIFDDMMITPPDDDVELKQMSYVWKHGYNGLKVFREQIDRKNYRNGECLVKMLIEPTVSFDISQGIYCGGNSGFGAMMLAVALRANPIYLLGFDLKVNVQEDRTHWHNGYPGQTPRLLLRKMQGFKEPFELLAPKLADLGIKIINLGPDSDLKCFPEQNVEDILHK
jgi:hypothetical protein